MTHYDELTYSIYLDGELESETAREVRSHLSGCVACREKLRELEKVHLRLKAALGEVVFPASLLAAPARTEPTLGLQWVSALAAALGAVGLYLVANFLSRLLALEPLEWLNLTSLDGFFQFFFEPLRRFIAEDWMKRWMDWAGMGAVGLLLVSAFYYLRRVRVFARMVLAALALLILAGGSVTASAAEFRHVHTYTLREGQVVHNDLVVMAGEVRIDGTVEGDVMAFAQSISINGTVKGDLIAFARDIQILGTVSDDVRGFAQNLSIEGKVGKHVTAFCQKLELRDKSQVASSFYGFAEEARVNGHLLRDLTLMASRTTLSGQVDGAVKIQGHTLMVGSDARIPGTIVYRGHRKAEIESGAVIGKLDFVQLTRKPAYTQPRYYLRQAIRYAGTLLLAALLIWLAPRPFERVTANVGSLARGLGLGLLLTVSIPVVAIILMVTWVGLPIGLVMCGLYLILLYCGQIFVGTWLGAKILSRPEAKLASIGAAAVGLLIYRLSKFLPWIGTLATVAVACIGLGAICYEIYTHLQPRRGQAVVPPAPIST